AVAQRVPDRVGHVARRDVLDVAADLLDARVAQRRARRVLAVDDLDDRVVGVEGQPAGGVALLHGAAEGGQVERGSGGGHEYASRMWVNGVWVRRRSSPA